MLLQSNPEQTTPLPPDKVQRVEEALDYLQARQNSPTGGNSLPREELRQTFHTLTAAYMELGYSTERAVLEALAQMQRGNTSVEVKPTATHLSPTHALATRPATLLSLAFFGSFYLADASQFAGRLWGERDAVTLYRLEALLVPLLCGLLVGLWAKRNAVQGVLHALAFLTLPAIFLPAIGVTLDVLKLDVSKWATWLESSMTAGMWNPQPGLVGLVCWFPLGCLGASLGERVRRWRRR